MKIAYLISSTYNNGGMERILCDVTSSLVARCVDVYIVTTNQQDKTNFFSFNTTISFHDLNISYEEGEKITNFKKRRSRLKELRDEYLYKTESTLNEIKPDITVTLSNEDISSLKDGSKKVAWFHYSAQNTFVNIKSRYSGVQYISRYLLAVWRRKEVVRGLNKLSRFVVLTKEDTTLWKGVNNISYIPNFPQYEWDDMLQRDYSVKRVITAGRFVPLKGFHLLIDAWAIVAKRFPDWKLSIFGDGQLKDKLQQQIEALSLNDVVVLEGRTNDMYTEYLTSSIYAMSSGVEGMPLVLLEAMICKLPIVSYACPCGPKELIDDGKTGVLVGDYGNIKCLAEGIIRLIESESLRQSMGQLGYEKSKTYNRECIVDSWVSLFDEIITEK